MRTIDYRACRQIVLLAAILATVASEMSGLPARAQETGCAAEADQAVAHPAVWRSGWTSMARPEETIACARELGFNALIFHGSTERMKQWSALTKAADIESYYWFSPIIHKNDADLTPMAQVMSDEDQAALQKLRAAKDPKKDGYQFGGQPLPARRDAPSPDHDVLLGARLLCFHRPESMAWCRKQISDMLLACPDLTGVGLDYFGY